MTALAASIVPIFFRIVLVMEKMGVNIGALLYQKKKNFNEVKMRRKKYV